MSAVTVSRKSVEFQPVTLTTVFNTKAELDAYYQMVNHGTMVANLIAENAFDADRKVLDEILDQQWRALHPLAY